MFHPVRHRRRLISLGTLVLSIALPAWSSVDENRKAAASRLAGEIEHSQVHKIYVADFLNPMGAPDERGCLFASIFSTNLKERAGKFEVVNRIEAQKQLDAIQIAASDLQKPESLTRASAALGVDAIIVGTLGISNGEAQLSLTVLDAGSGKEPYSTKYLEQLTPGFESSFPAAGPSSGHVHYFAGQDGVSVPKCISCPQPEYSDDARKNKLQGVVMMSVRVTETGTITNVRVVQDPGHGMAEASLDVVKNWRLEPSRDLAGNPVPVQVAIETTFKLYFGKPRH